jgi:hypothetical protein
MTDPARNAPETNRAIADMFQGLADSLAPEHLTAAQHKRLRQACADYAAEYDPANYQPTFDLPTGWVAGWVGPIYVGCSPEGDIHS